MPIGSMSPLAGMEIVLDATLTERIFYGRSPSRARRRQARGYRQHYIDRPIQKVFVISGRTLLMHPSLYEQVKARLASEQIAAVLSPPR